MTTATTYELVLRGRPAPASCALCSTTSPSTTAPPAFTRLVGPVLDACHLHGVLAHLSSVGVELVSLGPVASPDTQPGPPDSQSDPSHTSIEIKVSYLRPVHGTSGPLVAAGKMVKPGSGVAFAEGSVSDAFGKVVATATSTLLVFSTERVGTTGTAKPAGEST